MLVLERQPMLVLERQPMLVLEREPMVVLECPARAVPGTSVAAPERERTEAVENLVGKAAELARARW